MANARLILIKNILYYLLIGKWGLDDGTKKKQKKEAQRTRQLLIESAIQQFALRGVTNTTLTDIADGGGSDSRRGVLAFCQ